MSHPAGSRKIDHGTGSERSEAVHTPVWDLLFGTYHLPDRWPKVYGLCGGSEMPAGWLRQFVHPFRRRRVPVPCSTTASESETSAVI
ncbi:MAG: hypothetical protein H0T47_12345 [Planctomycetaceae bacterium]|nr:hypothetical protein [Planctomycetaceae bacterium]